MKVSTSFLSCKKILPAIYYLSLTDADYLHVDFIDGKFVDGKKIPFRKLKKIRKLSSKRLDVHLMTSNLDKYIRKFTLLNCEYISFHVEATKNIEKYIRLIHSYGIKCGLAINPDTDITVLEPYLDMIDLILVMSVKPGYGGQKFIESTPEKLSKLKDYLKENKAKITISVDGGINNETVKLVKPYVDMIVSGSFVTSSTNYQEQINILKEKNSPKE